MVCSLFEIELSQKHPQTYWQQKLMLEYLLLLSLQSEYKCSKVKKLNCYSFILRNNFVFLCILQLVTFLFLGYLGPFIDHFYLYFFICVGPLFILLWSTDEAEFTIVISCLLLVILGLFQCNCFGSPFVLLCGLLLLFRFWLNIPSVFFFSCFRVFYNSSRYIAYFCFPFVIFLFWLMKFWSL